MRSPPDDRHRAQAVAAVAAGLARARGRVLPDELMLWQLAGGHDVGTVEMPTAVEDLAEALEASTPPEERRRSGLHVTPRWLADHLVELAFAGGTPGGRAATPAGIAVCDPACGGGVFLLAAAQALHASGLGRREVVREGVWGADTDPVGLAAAEAALALWAGEAPPPGRLVVADPLTVGVEAWPEPPRRGFDLVIGNPPFHNQLGRATARAGDRQQALRDRYGDAVRAYTDTAWLFLLLACDLTAPGGRVVMLQPQSLVAARDAGPVRAAVDARARLCSLWVEEKRVFDASVRVCAPVLEVMADGPEDRVRAPAAAPPADAWRDALADALHVPVVRLTGRGQLGDVARVVAGFRDEYYGLVPVVREAGSLDRCEPAALAEHDPAAARLVTSGAIDWACTTWGDVPVRYARRRWTAPVVDLGALARDGDRAARRWVRRTAGPKVLVANQTRAVEAVVDETGCWVPSIPVLAVVPHDPDVVWLIAAALLAPITTAWLARRAPGTALTRSAIKVAAPDLAAVPLPSDRGAWHQAAEALASLARAAATPKAAMSATSAGEVGDDTLDVFVEASAAAYGVAGEPGPVTAWWHERRPR